MFGKSTKAVVQSTSALALGVFMFVLAGAGPAAAQAENSPAEVSPRKITPTMTFSTPEKRTPEEYRAHREALKEKRKIQDLGRQRLTLPKPEN